MRWLIDYGERDWHRWFAWYPVQLSEQRGHKVWLEWIEKQTENVQGYLIHRYRLPNGFKRMTKVAAEARAPEDK